MTKRLSFVVQRKGLSFQIRLYRYRAFTSEALKGEKKRQRRKRTTEPKPRDKDKVVTREDYEENGHSVCEEKFDI